MKRRQFARVAGAGAAGTILAAPAIAQSSPEIKWRWITSFPKTAESSWPATQAFCRRVSELTDGKFQIQLHGAGELAPPLQVLDAVQSGSVDAGFTATYFYNGKDPTFGFASVVPCGMNTRQHAAWMYAGGGLKLMNEFFDTYGVHYQPMGFTGAQMGGWYRKEIKSVADLKGLKIRIAGMGAQVMLRLGAVPQLLSASDTYAALERGVIDAAEYTNPVDDESMGLNKVTKYYYYPGWWEGTVQVGHFINKKKWEELPERYKIAIQTVAIEQEQVILNQYDARNATALKRLVGAGVQLKPFPRDVMAAGYKATFEYLDEIAAGNPAFKKVLNHYMAFRDDAMLWFRVAEATYDNFMMSEWARLRK